jgi:hypothetical protein
MLFADRRGVTKAGIGVDPRGLGTLTLVDRAGGTVEQPANDPPDSAAADQSHR